MLDLAVVILTFNEERHIGRALASIRTIAREVVIVDSFSTDRTTEIAEAAGCIVLTNKFVNHANQFNWGVANAPLTAEWIMRLDADEVIEENLVDELRRRLPLLSKNVVGVNLKRKHIFMGRWIRYGGRYPLLLLRIWRRGQGRVEQRWMDEHVVVWGGQTVTFNGGFADHNLNDLTFFTDKHNDYATREALDILVRKYKLVGEPEGVTARSTSFQASVKRSLKEKVYNRLPFWCGPLCYFLYRYIFQGGFLDGRPGLIYHFLQAGWYRFLVGAKLVEYETELAKCETRVDRLQSLQLLTGHDLLGGSH